jgi:hypothetical protein
MRLERVIEHLYHPTALSTTAVVAQPETLLALRNLYAPVVRPVFGQTGQTNDSCFHKMERPVGYAPTPTDWQSVMLLLHYRRLLRWSGLPDLDRRSLGGSQMCYQLHQSRKMVRGAGFEPAASRFQTSLSDLTDLTPDIGCGDGSRTRYPKGMSLGWLSVPLPRNKTLRG